MIRMGWKNFKNEDERYKECIDNSGLSKINKAILWEWSEERRANQYRDKNNVGLIGTIRRFGEYIGKDFDKIDKSDVKDFFTNTLQCPKCRDFFSNTQEKCNDCDKVLRSLSNSTELWYKKALRRFYKWMADDREQSSLFDCVRWIDTRRLSSKCSLSAMKKREDNLLNPSEVRKMLKSAVLLRDKLAISLLADSGVRAETIGASHNQRSINIGQIEFKENYAIIHDIEEKFDKKRDVVVTEALSYLIKYFNEHPFKDDLDSPLFLNYSTNRRNQRWGYSGLKNMLQNVSNEAIGRQINPHDFRHLKGTRLHLDENLSDDAKCKLMGWSSRRMLDRYNHTTFEDAKEEYLIQKGILKIDKNKKKVESAILLPKQCPRCSQINTPTDEVCDKCGMTLDMHEILREYEALKKGEKEVTKFLNIPEVQELYKVVHKLQLQVKELSK